MRQIQDAFLPNLSFPIFEKSDIVHLEYDGHEPVKAKIISCSNFDYYHDGKGHGVSYCVVDGDEVVHNIWGFCIKELRSD